MKEKESDIQKAILEYLSLLKIFHYRNNTGAYKTESGGFVRYGAVGSPDIVCIVRGQFVGIEVKRPGGKLSDNQKMFVESVTKAGGRYIVAYSIDDVINKL